MKEKFFESVKKNFLKIIKMIFLLAVAAAGFWAIINFVPNDLMNGYHGRLSLYIIWGSLAISFISRLIASKIAYWLSVSLFVVAIGFFFVLAISEIMPGVIQVFEKTDVIITIAPLAAAMVLILNALKIESKI